MPYYQWRGVDIQAHIQTGALFAQSPEQLATILLKKEIYLLDARAKHYRFIIKRVTHSDLTSFFHHLATLLEAKVHLSDALPLVIEQSDNTRFQTILHIITDSVQSGIPFHTALKRYPKYFPPLILQLLEVGQESGTMGLSCHIIAAHMQEQSTIHNKIRSALLLPGLTLACFIAIVTIIFVALIPRFAATFSSLKVPLPQSTQTLLYISSCITISSIIGLLCGIGLIPLLFYKLSQIARFKLLFSYILLRIPFIGPLMHHRFCASFFQSLSILIEHAIPIDKAVALLGDSEKNSFFKTELFAIQKALHSGVTLSNALSRSDLNLFNNTSIAMTAIGEESGNLVFMLTKITECSMRTIQKKIHVLTSLVQPVLMVILGLCIALLITLLYIPLFNLSLSIGNQ